MLTSITEAAEAAGEVEEEVDVVVDEVEEEEEAAQQIRWNRELEAYNCSSYSNILIF